MSWFFFFFLLNDDSRKEMLTISCIDDRKTAIPNNALFNKHSRQVFPRADEVIADDVVIIVRQCCKCWLRQWRGTFRFVDTRALEWISRMFTKPPKQSVIQDPNLASYLRICDDILRFSSWKNSWYMPRVIVHGIVTSTTFYCYFRLSPQYKRT